MMFILFSLVMRTAYQGKQFEFMKKEMRRPDVQTIDEMIEQNFTLIYHRANLQFYADMDFMKKYKNNYIGLKKRLTYFSIQTSN